jgi:hypothetical protein
MSTCPSRRSRKQQPGRRMPSPGLRTVGQNRWKREAAPELPPLESLDENSDYSAFLDSRVDTDTQREALRKLFRSPKFNVTDGLDDYDLDYTNPEPLGNIVTAEMRHRIQLELEKLAGLDDESEDPVETVAAVDSDAQDEPAEEADVDTNDEHPEPS